MASFSSDFALLVLLLSAASALHLSHDAPQHPKDWEKWLGEQFRELDPHGYGKVFEGVKCFLT